MNLARCIGIPICSSCACAQVRCADRKTNSIVMIFLAVYVILTNLLLFNLIISIFNKAIEDIEGKLH